MASGNGEKELCHYPRLQQYRDTGTTGMSNSVTARGTERYREVRR